MTKEYLSPNSIHSEYSIFTVISGSFRKHLLQIIQLKKQFEQNYVSVLSPAGDMAVNPGEEFIILDSDPVTHPRILQDSVFAKMRRSTFLTVANIGGYLGKAAILEMGYAIAIGLAIYTLEPVEDPNLAPYCKLLQEVFPDFNYELFDSNPALRQEEPKVACNGI